MSFIAPVVDMVAGEPITLPKLILREFSEAGLLIAMAEREAIKRNVPDDEKSKPQLLMAASAEMASNNIATLPQKAWTDIGFSAIWTITEKKLKAKGKPLLSDSQLGSLRQELDDADIEHKPTIDGFELLKATQNPEWLASMAYRMVTPNVVPKVDDKKKEDAGES